MLELQRDDREALLTIARDAVEAAAAREPVTTPEVTGALAAPAGAFVTLYAGDELRGCIGTFDTSQPLATTVSSMAEAAATRDTRFSPVQPHETDGLTVSLSVLAPPVPVSEVGEIKVGRDSLIVSYLGRRGVLLPKVAADRGWTSAEFLAATCMKARLDRQLASSLGQPDGIQVSRFQSLDISEGAPDG